MDIHKTYLTKALALAREYRGCCAPNPCVGAVLVKNNKQIASGCHIAAGQPHAEIVAIQQAGCEARSATLYVTLEPCAHTGRTPPCVDAIIRANINAVFFSYRDPNPMVCGNGQQILKNAGIICEQVNIAAINQFYQSYYYWSLNKKPHVTIKLAISADGKIAWHKKPAAISGEKANAFTHQQRKAADAILTTINNVLIDNPQLNARCGNDNIKKAVYVLDSQLQFPLDARLVKTTRSLTLLHATTVNHEKKLRYQQAGIRCIGIKRDIGGVSLDAALSQIGKDGVHDLWVEVGSNCFQSFLTQKLAHEVYLYLSTTQLGKHAKPAFEQLIPFNEDFQIINYQQAGEDLILHFDRKNTIDNK